MATHNLYTSLIFDMNKVYCLLGTMCQDISLQYTFLFSYITPQIIRVKKCNVNLPRE